MRKLLLLTLMTAFVAADGFAQWSSVGQFPPDTTFRSSIHGLAVDGEGKVWIAPFGGTETLTSPTGGAVTVRALYVYNPDGTPASFSPITILTTDGVVDTLKFSTRGLTTDHNGHILYSSWDVANTGDPALFRINHQTGESMDKVVLTPPLDNRGVTAAAVDENGNIFISDVFPGGPIAIYDADFNFVENAVDSSRGFSRDFMVTADGNAIYWAGYTNLAIWKYTRPDEFSPFNVVPDTLFRGVTAESFERGPDGLVWFSAGPSGS